MERALVVRFSALEQAAEAVQEAAGMGASELVLIKFLMALFGSVLLALPQRSLPGPAARHVYAAAAGMLLLQFVFAAGWLHLLTVALVGYALLALTQSLRALDGWRHWLAAVWALGYLTWRHAARAHVHAASMDYIAPLMVLTVKLYAFAYNLHDGTGSGLKALRAAMADAEGKLAAAKDAKDDVAAKKIASRLRGLRDREARSLPALPSLLQYLGFVFNYATVLAGPAFEISEYLRGMADWTEGTAAPVIVNSDAGADVVDKRAGGSGRGTAVATDAVPLPAPAISRFPAAAVALGIGLSFLAANALLQPHLPVEDVYWNAIRVLRGRGEAVEVPEAGQPGCRDDGTATMPLWRYIITSHAALLLLRCGYYAVWKVAEAATITAGFGYIAQPPQPHHQPTAAGAGSGSSGAPAPSVSSVAAWSGVTNVRIAGCEASPSISAVLRNWNVHTQGWLQRYIHGRAPRSGQLNFALVFLASAFWHGLYPGYYLGFLTAPLLVAASRGIKAALKPWLSRADGRPLLAEDSPLQWPWWLLRVVITQLSLDYALSAFALYQLHRAVTVWRSLFWAGHIISGLLIAAAVLIFALRWAVCRRKASKRSH